MDVRPIGVDWSTMEANRGVAVVDCTGDALSLVDLVACGSRRTAAQVIADAVSSASRPSLLAIDAPLGWPAGLSAALATHCAGEPLTVSPDDMFSRATDRFVQQTLTKRPLEVGANFIARTAHSANRLLGDLGQATGRPIPLLWSPAELRDIGAIEVYPAATKRTVPQKSAAAALRLDPGSARCPTAHVEDALWCVVAGLHFIRGECHEPADVNASRREGWIWFRR